MKSWEIYEAFTADDGEPATRPADWPKKVARLEGALRRVITDNSVNYERAERAEAACSTLRDNLEQAQDVLKVMTAERDEALRRLGEVFNDIGSSGGD